MSVDSVINFFTNMVYVVKMHHLNGCTMERIKTVVCNFAYHQDFV